MKLLLCGLVFIAGTVIQNHAFGGQPILVDPDTGKYLGNLNNNRYDPNSVSNPYGQYGSQYSPDSVNNSYGQYGSQYSPDGVQNQYSPGHSGGSNWSSDSLYSD